MNVYDAVLNRILHEFSFNINIYETSLRNIVKRASGELDNELKIIFIMRLSMDLPLDTFSTGFSDVPV